MLDYANRRARAEFHVRLSFPQFAETLEDLGVDPALSQPVQAVLRSEGDILDDHGFALSGTCDLEPHGLLPGRRHARPCCRDSDVRTRAPGRSPDPRRAQEGRIRLVAVHA